MVKAGRAICDMGPMGSFRATQALDQRLGITATHKWLPS